MKAIKLVIEETGKPIIPLLVAWKPCDVHAKTATPWTCMCKTNQRAKWKSARRESIWKPLWFSQQEKFIAESLGISVAGGTQAIHPDAVERMRVETPRMLLSFPPRFIFITMDPAEGGLDEFAIQATAMVDGCNYVVRRAAVAAALSRAFSSLVTRSRDINTSRFASSTSHRKYTSENAAWKRVAFRASVGASMGDFFT